VTEPIPATDPDRSRRPVAAVLAGGRASRLGGDKANAVLAGNSLLGRALASLEAAGLEAFVVSKRDRPVEVEGVEVVIEEDEPQHALAGIATAIRQAGDRQVIVLACDLPLLPVEYLEWLATRDGGTLIPCPGGEAQPLAARYSPADLGPIEAALAREAPVRQAAAGLGATLISDAELARFGDPAVTFFNVNTPEDLLRADELLAAG